MDKKRREFLKQYTGWGVTVVVVSALVLLIFFCIYRAAALKELIGGLIGILMPVIYGLVIAYLLSPIYNYLRKNVLRLLRERLRWTDHRVEVTATAVAMFLTFAIMFAILAGLLVLLIPRLIDSITGIIATFPTTVNTMSMSLYGTKPDRRMIFSARSRILTGSPISSTNTSPLRAKDPASSTSCTASGMVMK